MRQLRAKLWCKWQYWVTKYPFLKRWNKSYRETILAEHPIAYHPLDEKGEHNGQ